MIIFGTRGITSVLQKGSYHCPACGAGADFERKGVRRWFTLFFIPCIPLHQAADYVECKRCGGTFKPDVLNWNGVVPGQTPPPIPGAPQQEIHQLRPSIDPKTGMPLPPPVPQPQYAGSTVVSYQSNGLATASMVLGILGLITSFLVCPAVVFVPLSLLFGLLALGKVKNGNGLVGGKGAAIAGIACSLVALLAAGGMLMLGKAESEKSKAAGHLEEPWKQAAAHVEESATQTAWGNTAEAKKLAEQFVTTIAPLHAISFTGKRGREVDSRFVAHCELTEGKCAFIICVPDYRRYKGDTRDSLNELVWLSARKAALSANLPETTQVCVAQKGLVMFGDILTGTLADTAPTGKGTDTDVLKSYFAAPLSKVSTAPATGDEEAPLTEEEIEELED